MSSTHPCLSFILAKCLEKTNLKTKIIVLQFASRISGMRFCESSAKDNFNVDEIFLKLVDDILSKVSVTCFPLFNLQGYNNLLLSYLFSDPFLNFIHQSVQITNTGC